MLVETISAQNKDGKIIYQVVSSPYFKKAEEEIQRTESQKMADKIFNLSVNKIKKLRWKLTFSDNKAIFKDVPIMGITQREEALIMMAKAFVYTHTSYYTDIEKHKLIIERNFNYENYLISKSINISTWKLTSNTKKIGDYLCYEAHREIELMRRGKPMFRKQQVWYTPQIPLPFGPKEFVGFPGLVLEVTSGATTFVASKIELSNKKTVIKIPTKGKKITEQEFKKMMKENTSIIKPKRRNRLK